MIVSEDDKKESPDKKESQCIDKADHPKPKEKDEACNALLFNFISHQSYCSFMLLVNSSLHLKRSLSMIIFLKRQTPQSKSLEYAMKVYVNRHYLLYIY